MVKCGGGVLSRKGEREGDRGHTPPGGVGYPRAREQGPAWASRGAGRGPRGHGQTRHPLNATARSPSKFATERSRIQLRASHPAPARTRVPQPTTDGDAPGAELPQSGEARGGLFFSVIEPLVRAQASRPQVEDVWGRGFVSRARRRALIE